MGMCWFFIVPDAGPNAVEGSKVAVNRNFENFKEGSMRRATVVLVACVAVLAVALISGSVSAKSVFDLTGPRSSAAMTRVESSPLAVAESGVDVELKHAGRYPVECIWGSTYSNVSNNTGQVNSIPEEGEGNLPVTDQQYDPNPATIDWPFSLDGTGWIDVDQGRSDGQEILLEGYEPNDRYTAKIWAMNNEDYLLIAFETDMATPVTGSEASRSLTFYFDPDHYTDPGQAHFITGNAFMASFLINENGTVTLDRSGWVIDWDGPDGPNGNVGTWDKNDTPDPWPDAVYAGNIAASAGFAPNMGIEGDARKTGRWHFQMRIPISYLGCHTSLGSKLGMSICFKDNEDGNGVLDETGAGSEELWWPQDVEDYGDCQEQGWDVTDALYMGNLNLSYRGTGSICVGDRLWGVYFDLTELDETTWLVLKNPHGDYGEFERTAIRFYESDYSVARTGSDYDAEVSYGGSVAGLQIASASMCIDIPAHGVYVLNLRDVVDRDTRDPGVLIGKIGAIEISNPGLTGYVSHLKGITTGIHANSVNLLPNSPSVSEYSSRWPDMTPTADGVSLINSYYTVAQQDNYSTKIALFNPSCCYSAVVTLNVFEWPGTADQLLLDSNNRIAAIDPTSGYQDIVELLPHQVLLMDVGTLIAGDIIANPLYRRGSVEVVVNDGDDQGLAVENEILIGTTWRYSTNQAYADAMRVYYIGNGEGGG